MPGLFSTWLVPGWVIMRLSTVCKQLPRLTQPAHPYMNRFNEYKW